MCQIAREVNVLAIGEEDWSFYQMLRWSPSRKTEVVCSVYESGLMYTITVHYSTIVDKRTIPPFQKIKKRERLAPDVFPSCHSFLVLSSGLVHALSSTNTNITSWYLSQSFPPTTDTNKQTPSTVISAT